MEKIKKPVCPACNFDLAACLCGRLEKEDSWINCNPLTAAITRPFGFGFQPRSS